MSTEENKATIRRIYDEFNKGNYDIVDECFADDFKVVRNSGLVLDRDGLKNFLVGIQNGIPDLQRTLNDIVAEGDNVAFNFTWTGTDKNGIGGAPATGKQLTIKEAYFSRFKNGKIVEYKQFSDTLVMLQQGGFLPPTQEIIQAYTKR